MQQWREQALVNVADWLVEVWPRRPAAAAEAAAAAAAETLEGRQQWQEAAPHDGVAGAPGRGGWEGGQGIMPPPPKRRRWVGPDKDFSEVRSPHTWYFNEVILIGLFRALRRAMFASPLRATDLQEVRPEAAQRRMEDNLQRVNMPVAFGIDVFKLHSASSLLLLRIPSPSLVGGIVWGGPYLEGMGGETSDSASHGLVTHFPRAWIVFMSKIPEFARVKVGPKRRRHYQIVWTRFTSSVPSFVLSRGRFHELQEGREWYVHLAVPCDVCSDMDVFSSLTQNRLDLAQLIRHTVGYTIFIGEGTFDLTRSISEALLPPRQPLPHMSESAWAKEWSV